LLGLQYMLMLRLGILCALILSIMLPVKAQQSMVLLSKESRVIIHGTSSLHAWQCKVEQYSGQLSALFENQNLADIGSLVLSINANSIKSIGEKGEYYDKNMDKNIYRALNSEKYPTITFTLSQFKRKSSATGKNLMVEATGHMRIAGVTREVQLQGTCTATPTELVIEGKLPLKMRDYNVEPPTAIFGTIKTGNEVIIEYKMVYRLLSSGR
jgi:polyisoprenoid-binding protein YceI